MMHIENAFIEIGEEDTFKLLSVVQKETSLPEKISFGKKNLERSNYYIFISNVL